MKLTTIMAGLLFLVTLSGCSSLWEEKVTEMKSASLPWADDKGIMLTSLPWADDKGIMLDICLDCFHLGPLGYEEMIAALADK